MALTGSTLRGMDRRASAAVRGRGLLDPPAQIESTCRPAIHLLESVGSSAKLNRMEPSRKSIIAIRIGCVLLPAAAFFFVLHHVNAAAMIEALRTMRPGWFVAAIGLYGLLFLPAAWRWHLALRLAGNAVSFALTLRVAL